MTLDYLKETLLQYGMQDASAELIRHNENMTFKVDGRYLLRIHKHVEGFHTASIYNDINRIEIYQEELNFLKFLRTHGINVQIPYPNKNDELVTILSDGTAATMLTWLPGRILEKNEVEPDLCVQIGEMVGKLHQQACLCPKLSALQYNDALCDRLKQTIYIKKEEGAWNELHTQSMANALDFIAGKLHDFRNDAILTHADLSLSNIILTDTGLVPIDFSLFGYCHPMMDLASLFCNINGLENRRAMAAGYRSADGNIVITMLDCCFALNILLSIVLHCNWWPKNDWFLSRLERWCREVFTPLAHKEALFSEDFYLLHAT